MPATLYYDVIYTCKICGDDSAMYRSFTSFSDTTDDAVRDGWDINTEEMSTEEGQSSGVATCPSCIKYSIEYHQ